MNNIDYLLTKQKRPDYYKNHNQNNSISASLACPSNCPQNSNCLNSSGEIFGVKLVDETHSCKIVAVDNMDGRVGVAGGGAAEAVAAGYECFAVYVARRNPARLRRRDQLCPPWTLAASWLRACTRTFHCLASTSFDGIEVENDFEAEDGILVAPHGHIGECIVAGTIFGFGNKLDLRLRREYHYYF